jgi:rhamnose transport system ATP-binding protein
LIDGRPTESWSPLDASRAGIAVMHQHPGLFGDLSVCENIYLGHMPRTPLGGVDRQRVRRRASELLDVVGLACRPERLLKDLRTSEQQLVEIARALSVDARVLILDEPTAALSQREVDRLFAVMSDLRSQGVAMMFVSHRMEEIYRVASRIAVLRDGRLIGAGPTEEIGRNEAVQRWLAAP